jgi:hypothetical protein
MRTRNWGVAMYIVAALAAIFIPLVLTLSTGAATQLFPQAGHQDLVRAVHALLPGRLMDR